MRVISGRFGGRKLAVPMGRDIRPTSDKIRGALFNILRSRGALVKNGNVLDLFCGTGALGIEALSQNAGFCTFVDKARMSLDLARDNVEMLGLSRDEAHFMQRDAGTLARRPNDYPLFDLVFLDPPYARDLVVPALTSLDKNNWLGAKATVVVETERRSNDVFPLCYQVVDERTYGDTKITFLLYSGCD